MDRASPSEESDDQSTDERIRQAKSAVAKRLRYVRQHHPEGPFTLEALAKRAGVSKRTLAQAESASGSNLTIETLVKVASSLGITRDAYFLDEQVFREVNAELETLKELRQQGVESVALRQSSATALPSDSLQELTGLLKGILDSATKAQDTLQDIPHHQPDETDS
ncbi:helix-turn-helix domain-containing protein [Streptomyces sp. SID8361]|uniref:helix-turn-helix domain-containing protein n=1 Tax=Streptomyces sp. MnatMP-M27 TaxID=1839768 RepID=UPI00081DF6C9|nr:helix-turn-helix transcriptional regulator [Streptomyces sp. MnatMP-M27]MYU09761.1 helix-turn-helix domain-containing protein [Streptomyces sp. SID8361]SCF65081.1 Helix-turn-helix [Streptomyces sp. MnatMP-M27]